MSNESICLTPDQLRSLITAPSTLASSIYLTNEQSRAAEKPRYVLVRGDRSGVFCGVLVSEEGRTVELTECRHIWYWAGAANMAEMSLTGTARPNDCKIVAPVGRLRVLDAIEIVDCTPTAEASLRAVPNWSKK